MTSLPVALLIAVAVPVIGAMAFVVLRSSCLPAELVPVEGVGTKQPVNAGPLFEVAG